MSRITRLDRHVRRVVFTRDGDTLTIELRRDGLYLRSFRGRVEYGPLSYGRLLLEAARDYAAAEITRPMGVPNA